jgi:hypothetical protein
MSYVNFPKDGSTVIKPGVDVTPSFCPVIGSECLQGKCAFATFNDDGDFMMCAITLNALVTNNLLVKK